MTDKMHIHGNDLQKDYDSLKQKYMELLEADNRFRKNMEERLMKAREEANAANSMKSAFIGKISHNIRIPLNGIMGILDLLKQTNIDSEQKEYLNIISNYGNNLLAKVNDILDFSRIIGNEIELQSDTFSLKQLTDDLYELMKLNALGKGIKLSFSIDDQLPDSLIGDAGRIAQICSNFLTNALQNTRSGIIKLEIFPTDDFIQSKTVCFQVTDQGRGMSKELSERIRNGLISNKQDQLISADQSGLGLIISKFLVDKMKGSIGFSTEVGKGSSFWFTVMLDSPHQTQAGSEKAKPDHREGLKILLVEDNLLNQKFAKATLKKVKHFVEIAENGQIAVQKFTENPDYYDLILMDVQMPVMDGIEATRQIRAFEKSKNLPGIVIAAVTAYALDHDYEQCMDAGMNAFLAKPFKPNELIELIDEIEL